MDWSKAKTILIVALLATNLFLIFTYGFKDKEINEMGNEEALISILADRGISLAIDIPRGQQDMPLLHGEYLDFDEEEVRALIESQSTNQVLDYQIAKGIEIKTVEGQVAEDSEPTSENALKIDANDKEYIEAAKDFIGYLGFLNENVVFDHITYSSRSEEAREERDPESQGQGQEELQEGGEKHSHTYIAEVVFRNEIAGIRIEGSQMTCTFENGKLTDFGCMWLSPIDFSTRKAETISASVALMSLPSPRGGDQIEIVGIEMVYSVPDMEIEFGQTVSDTAFPTWKITAKDGEVFYVEAV